MEDYFTNVIGSLIANYHNNYWIGLYVRTARPNWSWTDPMAIAPNISDDSTYKHWGVYRVRAPPGPMLVLGLAAARIMLTVYHSTKLSPRHAPAHRRSPATRLSPTMPTRPRTALWQTPPRLPTAPGAGRTRAAQTSSSTCASCHVSRGRLMLFGLATACMEGRRGGTCQHTVLRWQAVHAPFWLIRALLHRSRHVGHRQRQWRRQQRSALQHPGPQHRAAQDGEVPHQQHPHHLPDRPLHHRQGLGGEHLQEQRRQPGSVRQPAGAGAASRAAGSVLQWPLYSGGAVSLRADATDTAACRPRWSSSTSTRAT